MGNEGLTEILVELTRGAEVESIHRGALAVARADGSLVGSCGNPGLRTFVRSSAKPFQALALFETGAIDRFRIPEEELAIVIASHSAEEFQVGLVRSLMDRVGIEKGWLQCGPQVPFDPVARDEMIRAGAEPDVLQNNCSGKHAGMIAASIAIGAPVEGYTEPDHPVQEINRRRMADLAGIATGEVGVAIDGCSVPTFGVPLDRFAAAFARLIEGGTEDLARVRDAMIDFPDVIAGNRERVDTALMRAAARSGIPLVAKAGAEGVYAIGVVSPREGPIGIALKIEDGGERARNVVLIESLRQLGVLPEDPAGELPAYGARPLTNRAGREIGVIRPSFAIAANRGAKSDRGGKGESGATPRGIVE